MAERWQVFATQVARCRRRASEPAIHDLRVATRRLIAVLEIVRTVCPESDAETLRRQLKRHLRAFSALRDIQVQIISVRNLTPRFPRLQLLRTVLMLRETQTLKQAQREVRSIHPGMMERHLATAETRLELLLADPLRRDLSRQIIHGVLGSAFSRAAGLRAGAMTGQTTRIHKYRVAFKRLRYTVEALRWMLPGADRTVLKTMNAYQTRMGVIQDIDVLIASVNAFARRHSRTAPAQWLGLKVYLMDRRNKLIAEFMAGAGELERYWRALFAVPS